VAEYGPALQHAYHEDLDYYDGRAEGLLASAQDATPTAIALFDRWDEPPTPAGARAVVARAHGFASWPPPRRRLRELGGSGQASPPPAPTAPSRPTTSTRCATSSIASPISRPRAGRTATTCSGWPAPPTTSGSSRCCSSAAPIRTAPTRMAGRRCTRRRTRA